MSALLDTIPQAWTQGAWPWVALVVVSLCVGSFLNLLSLRLPPLLAYHWRCECAAAGGDGPGAAATPPPGVVRERSHCPRCGATLGALELIPLFGFVWLGRRCAHCGGAISWRYPVVELLTLLVSLAVVWRLGWGTQAGAALFLSWALLVLALVDYDRMLLPDLITLPLLWCGLALSVPGLFASAPHAISGAIAAYLGLYLPHRAYRLVTGREGMGHGDFKLAAMLGAWLGWQQVPSMLFAATLGGAVAGLVLMALRRAALRAPLPFGPWLALSGWLHLLWEWPPLWRWW